VGSLEPEDLPSDVCWAALAIRAPALLPALSRRGGSFRHYPAIGLHRQVSGDALRESGRKGRFGDRIGVVMRMGVCVARFAPVVVTLAGIAAGAMGADPWADEVLSFDSGVDALEGYDQPLTALGSPERFSGEGVFPGAVTPFSPAWGADEIVSIGIGGWLTVRFDAPVRDDAQNPFGIDLLAFGNAGLIDTDWPNGIAGGVFGAGGVIEVSVDGVDWRVVPGVAPCGMFPTLGYSDLLDPYAIEPGDVLSDFTTPVDPAFDPAGLGFAEISAAYDGSGGGAGIDLALVGLEEISFVRISNPDGAEPIEIDGLSDVTAVPGAGAGWLLGVTAVVAGRRARR
jgi:hypothetical protein